MPAGRIHDRITLWGLPWIAGLTWGISRNTALTLLVSGSYLFAGLMFGPDLDINSRQYQRWGILRWIWLPYQRSIGHRSFLSHGPLVGTVLRVGYLLTWLGGLGLVGLLVWSRGQEGARFWTLFGDRCQAVWTMGMRTLERYPWEILGCWLGLELGAMSHSLSDHLGSGWKKWRQGRSRKSRRKS